MVIKPEIARVLRTSGITANGIRTISASPDPTDIKEKLDASGLSVEALFDDLRTLIISTDNDATKLNAIKAALAAHRIESEPVAQGTVINIIVNDPEDSSISVVNPILIPRQLER